MIHAIEIYKNACMIVKTGIWNIPASNSPAVGSINLITASIKNHIPNTTGIVRNS